MQMTVDQPGQQHVAGKVDLGPGEACLRCGRADRPVLDQNRKACRHSLCAAKHAAVPDQHARRPFTRLRGHRAHPPPARPARPHGSCRTPVAALPRKGWPQPASVPRPARRHKARPECPSGWRRPAADGRGGAAVERYTRGAAATSTVVRSRAQVWLREAAGPVRKNRCLRAHKGVKADTWGPPAFVILRWGCGRPAQHDAMERTSSATSSLPVGRQQETFLGDPGRT